MQLGSPGYLAPAALLLWDTLNDTQVSQLMLCLAASTTRGATGANLVWEGGNVMFRGVLQGNRTEAELALSQALNTIEVTPSTAEGIKIDGSFFQHGNQLYNGGYGQSFAYDITNLLALSAGTPLAPPPAVVEVFVGFLLNASLRMIHYGPASDRFGPPMWDVGVIGRDVSRPFGTFLQFGFGQSGQQVSWVTGALASIGGPHAAELDAYAAALNGSTSGPPAPALGNRYYWVGDYALHTTPTWMATLRMQSSRTLRCECVNGENAQGLHLADGATYMYRTGLEYAEIFPEWDWERVPGTTVKAGAVKLSCATVQGSSTNAFTGGASDGTVGTAVQDFTAPLSAGLSLRRHVTFFADAVAHAVRNVTSFPTAAVPGDALPVYTAVDSRALDVSGGGVWVGGVGAPGATLLAQPGEYDYAPGGGVGWLWHNGSGYVWDSLLPGGGDPAAPSVAPLHVSLAPHATGSWAAIGQEGAYGNTSVPLLAMWFTHPPGTAHGGAVGYTVVPDVALADFRAAMAGDNAATAYGTRATAPDGAAWTAVARGAGGPLALAAYEAGGANVIMPGGVFPPLSVTSPGAYLLTLDADGKRLTVTLANPLQARWATRVAVPSVALVPSSGPGYTCGPGGVVDFTAPPSDGSSATATCALA